MSNVSNLTHADFETVIGLEVHCQLATDSKIFCRCAARPKTDVSVADVDVNSNSCPICAAHPGTLPVLNQKVVEYAIRAGLATHSQIRLESVFSRKNYFYPDLPKGYQITQFDKPICEHGHLEVEMVGGARKIGIHRIHIEEDAGKNVHMDGFSLVNLNRAGVPLIEIVSDPDMRTPEEAGAYLRALYAIVTYLGICDGNLQEGNFRCDANVSVRPKGQKEFGTRAEIKNVNSFRFVEKAIEYEVTRQIDVILGGGKIVQETRLFDSETGRTFSMRSKEEAHDYRYFPEPDLMTLHVEQAWIDKIKASLPELPEQRRARYIQTLGLSPYDAQVLTGSMSYSVYLDRAADILKSSQDSKRFIDAVKSASNLITGEAARLVKESGIDLAQSKIKPEHIADIVTLTLDGQVSSTGAKQILVTAWDSGETAGAIVEKLGLRQVSDEGALMQVVEKVIAANAGQWAELKSGKDKLMGFFVGQAMKESKGKANPGLLQDLFRKKLS